MKTRLLVSCVALILAFGCCILSYPKYREYFAAYGVLKNNLMEIEQVNERVSSLTQEFRSLKGADIPQSLQEAAAFLSTYSDVEITSVSSFNLKDDGIEILGSVTSLADKTLCDGFEITVVSSDLIKFAAYLDTGNLTLHSVDFMFGVNTVILRVRTGGGFDE